MNLFPIRPTFPKNPISFLPQRRNTIKGLTMSFAAFALPLFASGKNNLTPATFPSGTKDENYWRAIKKQFTIEKGLVFLNAVNLAPSPLSVVQTLEFYNKDMDANPSFQNREKYIGLQKDAMEKLAAYFHADPSEFVLTRNTTESNNMIINGIEFKAGDEIIVWDQNHQSNKEAWEVRAERYGFTVKKVATPANPKSIDELIEPFQNAWTEKTRLLAFSHVSNVTGISLPAANLCQWAREKNILSLVDGAQTFGFQSMDLEKLGCDFYTGSAHKWFLGPRESGILYVRKEMASKIWPALISAGWDNAKAGPGASRLSNFGQRNYATLQGLAKAVDFHEAIGKEAIEARIRFLLSYLRKNMLAKIPGVQFATPAEPELSGGILVVKITGADNLALVKSLYEKNKIACSAAPGNAGIRIAPHVYNSTEDMDKLVAAMESLKG